MEQTRPTLPSEIKRRTLVEAGHRCAISTCRHIEVDIHHIVPWSECKKHEYENLIALCPNCHRRADRGEIDRKSLRIYKANLRYTHDKFSQFEVDVLFEVYKLRPGTVLPFPPMNALLIKRLLDARYVDLLKDDRGSISFFGVQASNDFLVITPQGRTFVESLGIDHEW